MLSSPDTLVYQIELLFSILLDCLLGFRHFYTPPQLLIVVSLPARRNNPSTWTHSQMLAVHPRWMWTLLMPLQSRRALRLNPDLALKLPYGLKVHHPQGACLRIEAPPPRQR